MSTVEEYIETLKDMGFSEEQAKSALNKTGWSGIEAAADWLLSNSSVHNDLDLVKEKSLVLSPGKVLTEEERISQSKRMEELRISKRIEREAREKQEQLEREKRRIEDGKTVNILKEQLAEKEMKKIVEERRRDKLEDKLAKERVKAQIEQDRKDRKSRENDKRETTISTGTSSTQQVITNTVSKQYTDTKLQIRQLDGKPMLHSFKVKETLAAVRLYVQLNRQDQPGVVPKLMSSFPKRIFSDEDYATPLDALGLVPSANLVISP